MVAGLEGTGHHALRAVLNPCLAQKICVTAVNLTNILFTRTQTNSLGLYGAGDAVHYDLRIEKVLFSLQDIAAAAKNMERSQQHAIVMQLLSTSGMMSYPNFDDASTKSLDHPDYLPLVLLAGAANVDLRIVVTQRRAYDVLYSTHLRRRWTWPRTTCS